MRDMMRLHYRTLGQGGPLIVLHGLLGSLDNWQPLARRFGAHFKVWAVDLRNHGQSPHSEDTSFDAMTADLDEFMRQHELPPAHLLGHSMGGKVAMQFALRHPNQVDRLVLVDVSPRAYPPRHARTLAALLALDLHAFQRREQLDAKLRHEAERRGISVSELTREAIEQHLGGSRRRLLAAGAGRSGHDDISERIEEILSAEVTR